MKGDFCRLDFGDGRTAGLVIISVFGVLAADAHEECAFHAVNGYRGAFKGYDRVDRVVVDQSVGEQAGLFAKLLWEMIVRFAYPVKGGGV